MFDVYASSALPPMIGIIVVLGSLSAFVAGVAIGWARGARRDALAKAAEASVGDKPPALVEGNDVVLTGIVRHYEDNAVAVKVSITQHGSENESSGSWSYSWTEVNREIILAPFLLELPSGEHVLVQPPKNVQVADALDQKVWINRTTRVLSAELIPGEQITARGRLERSDRAVAATSYRDVGWGWALTATTSSGMLLSSEPLGKGLAARGEFHRHAARIAMFFLFVTQCFAVPFYFRALGTVEPTAITDKREYDTESDDSTTHHTVIDLRDDSVEIGASDWTSLEKGDKVAVRVSSPSNWAIGSVPTISWLHGIFFVVVTSGYWIWYGRRRRSSRPWFRRKVVESGSGRLPDHG